MAICTRVWKTLWSCLDDVDTSLLSPYSSSLFTIHICYAPLILLSYNKHWPCPTHSLPYSFIIYTSVFLSAHSSPFATSSVAKLMRVEDWKGIGIWCRTYSYIIYISHFAFCIFLCFWCMLLFSQSFLVKKMTPCASDNSTDVSLFFCHISPLRMFLSCFLLFFLLSGISITTSLNRYIFNRAEAR